MPPPTMFIGDLEDRVETPMHLMMGLVKATVRMVLSWAGKRTKRNQMLNRMNAVLETIKSLRLRFLHVISVKDEKFGGYVAENYAVLSHLSPWLFRILTESALVGSSACDTELPNPNVKPQDEWTVQENKAWLIQHQLPCPNQRLAAEYRELVRLFMAGETIPNTLLPDGVNKEAARVPPTTLRALLLSMHNVFACLYASDLTGIEAANRLQAFARDYLSRMEDLDKLLMPTRTKPIWLAKYNCLGLLRSSSHFVHHCRVRSMYEGGDFGEAMVKELRQHVNKSMQDGWSKHLIDSHSRQKLLDDHLTPSLVASAADL